MGSRFMLHASSTLGLKLSTCGGVANAHKAWRTHGHTYTNTHTHSSTPTHSLTHLGRRNFTHNRIFKHLFAVLLLLLLLSQSAANCLFRTLIDFWTFFFVGWTWAHSSTLKRGERESRGGKSGSRVKQTVEMLIKICCTNRVFVILANSFKDLRT